MTDCGTCEVDGCSKPRYQTRRLCVTHTMRKHRYGDVHVDRARRAGPVITSAGYSKLRRPDHPIADSEGYVYDHRFVLYERIGPGTHACHWCGDPVTWGLDLEGDHVDGDRLNNASSNIVPSCHGCNTRRALGARWRDDAHAFVSPG